MALNDDDVREILRIIDESELDELRIETEGLSLHVLRGGVAPSDEPEPGAACRKPEPTAQVVAPESPEDGLTIVAPMIGVFYRAPGSGRGAVRRDRDARGAGHDRRHHRGDEDDELGSRRDRGHDRRDPRRERAAGRVRSAALPRGSADDARRRHRRHDDARRQPEPLGRHRPDRGRHPGDRADAGARRLSRARLHLEHAHGGLGSLPSRGPVGADPADAGGDAEHAAQLHHDRDALHRLAAVRRGRDAARLPLRRAQRDPPLPVRRAGQRSRGAPPRRPDGPRGRRGGDRGRAHLLDQPRAHARLLRRAGGVARRLRRTSTAST